MTLHCTTVEVRNILTRASGYLRPVCSHSLQPYRGCTYGSALCGVGCYVQHNPWLLRGERWGSFLEARSNAAAAYRAGYARERAWAQRARGRFSIFLSSSCDPFVPQEREHRLTHAVLAAMVELPPDELIVQTHSHRVTDYLELYPALAARTALRFHLSIEGDLDRLPGLPPPASTVERRLAAAAELRAADLRVVITCAPLHPLRQPEVFFRRIAAVADAVVLDHFIGGDGSRDGSRTAHTQLPAAMRLVVSESTQLEYRQAMARVAERHLPGRVGLGQAGFAGRFGPVEADR